MSSSGPGHWFALNGQPVLLGTAVVAYGLGLRHAVDADHIAAIDNVTRKLMQEGKQPVSVGLFFALGHSSVVLLASAAVAFTASVLGARSATLREIGATVGTLGLFRFSVADRGGESVELRGIWAAFRRVRRTRRLRARRSGYVARERGRRSARSSGRCSG